MQGPSLQNVLGRWDLVTRTEMRGLQGAAFRDSREGQVLGASVEHPVSDPCVCSLASGRANNQ